MGVAENGSEKAMCVPPGLLGLSPMGSKWLLSSVQCRSDRSEPSLRETLMQVCGSHLGIGLRG